MFTKSKGESFIVDKWQHIKKYKMAYIFMLPALTLLLVFMVIPLIRAIYLSFHDYDGLFDPNFIGVRNYINLFNDLSFWRTLTNNIIFSLFVSFFTVLFGLLAAIAIERRLKGWKIYKFTYFIPVILSLTVVGLLFGRILEPNYGLLNSLLRAIGLDFLAQSWLGNPKLSLFSIIMVQIWQYTGFTMLLLLTAVEGISEEIHDAATLDGVNGWQRIRYITVPMVKRVVFVVGMIQIIFSFKVFDIVWVMTRGGPGNSSEVLGTLLYKNAFSWSQYGYASTIGLVMTVFVFIFTFIYLKVTNLDKQEVE